MIAPPLAAFAQGLGLSLGLIAAIGAQNAHVLRQGLAGRYVGITVVLCALIDTALMSGGVFGMHRLSRALPQLEQFLRWGGVAFLSVYAARSFRAAFAGGALNPAARVIGGWRRAVAVTLAVSLLNPHVYLDTLVLVGGIGAQVESGARPFFVIGAALGSWLWFLALGFGAVRLRGLLARPGAWRVLEIFIGCVMLTVAAGLAF